MSLLRERAEQLARENLALRDRLIGSGYMPEGITSTLDTKVGPQNPLESIADAFGLYKGPNLEDLVKTREANKARYTQAVLDMGKAQTQKVKAEAKIEKAENKAESALDQDTVINRELDLANRLGEISSRLQREAGDISTEQSIKQMREFFPYLDEAGRRATERALSASQRYRAFKEQLPSSIQAIMESKQRQQQLASDAFAREAQAIATQQSAATGFGTQGIGRYSGRRIA